MISGEKNLKYGKNVAILDFSADKLDKIEICQYNKDSIAITAKENGCSFNGQELELGIPRRGCFGRCRRPARRWHAFRLFRRHRRRSAGREYDLPIFSRSSRRSTGRQLDFPVFSRSSGRNHDLCIGPGRRRTGDGSVRGSRRRAFLRGLRTDDAARTVGICGGVHATLAERGDTLLP